MCFRGRSHLQQIQPTGAPYGLSRLGTHTHTRSLHSQKRAAILPKRNQLRSLRVPTPTARIQGVTVEADVAVDVVETTTAAAEETVNYLLTPTPQPAGPLPVTTLPKVAIGPILLGRIFDHVLQPSLSLIPRHVLTYTSCIYT
jgi:hypothetical protein